MPLISVVIPVFNVEPYLCRCVESVLNQSFSDFELILVDDGSTDNCGIICDEYVNIDKRVSVIHKDNSGVSAARNAAIEIITGEYVIFCDADDYWKCNWLDKLVCAMSEYNADMAIGNYTKVTEENVVILTMEHETGFYELKNTADRTKYSFSQVFGHKHGWEIWTRIFRTDVIRNNNIRFCESCGNFAEDLIFVLEYTLFAERIVSIKCNDYQYCVRTGSMMDLSKEKIKLDEVNEASRYFYQQCSKFAGIYPIFSIYHFLIMFNQYYVITGTDKYKDLNKEIMKIHNRKYWKKWTRQIFKCKREMFSFFGKYNTYRILLLSHYCLHGNWKIFKIESAFFYKFFNSKLEGEN